VKANERALTLAEQQYRVGATDLRDVRSQQIELYAVRMQLLSLQGERIAQRINLYLALGGDFGG
jgi:multidrug efflux system outer membrane protein